MSASSALAAPRRQRRRGEAAAALVLLAPFAVLLAIFTVYPALKAVRDSFREFSALNPAITEWVGIEQYQRVLADPAFKRAILNSMLLMVVAVPCQTFFALLLANALNTRIRARGFFRTVFFMPYITSPVAVGAVMVYLFGPTGGLTRVLHSWFGMPSSAWYSQTPWAFILVALIMIWTQTGFYTIIYLAGLQSVPAEVHEAASLDGANSWTILRRITLPLLRPTTALVLLMGTIVSLQVFEQPYVLSTTGGALPGSPGDSTLTMVMYLYAEAFRYQRLGSASAAALVVMAVIVVFSILQAVARRRLFRS